MYILLFVLVANIWIWKIFSHNFLIFVSLVLATILAYLSLDREFKYKKILLFGFITILFLFQYKTTTYSSLTTLTNDQIRIRDMRLKEYPPIYIKLFGKVLWIPLAYWLEGRPESIAVKRVSSNIGEILDFNQYFFAGHPKERVGIDEFEKFPYILLPVFFASLAHLVRKRNWDFLVQFFLIPVLAMSLSGVRSTMGAFLLFPFLVVSISLGFHRLWFYLYRYRKAIRIFLLTSFLVIYFLIVIQMISYEIF